MRLIATDVVPSVVCMSVCLSVFACVGNTDELCNNGWIDRDAVWGLTRVGTRNHVCLLYTMYIPKRSGMDHTVLPANTLCRKRSPDGATPNWGKRHPIAAYYSSIDPEGMKGWVGLVGWPITYGLPILLVIRQLQVERRTGKVRQWMA